MRKESEFIGCSVINKNNGNKICNIKDIIYSKNKFKIIAFLNNEGGFLREKKIIRFKNIEYIGKDAIMVKNEKFVEKASSLPEIDKLIEESISMKGKEVISEDGESLGFIKDILIDEKKGKILGFVLTEGVIQDLVEGRNVIPLIKGMKFGEDNLLISKKIKDDFENNKEDFKKLLRLE